MEKRFFLFLFRKGAGAKLQSQALLLAFPALCYPSSCPIHASSGNMQRAALGWGRLRCPEAAGWVLRSLSQAFLWPQRRSSFWSLSGFSPSSRVTQVTCHFSWLSWEKIRRSKRWWLHGLCRKDSPSWWLNKRGVHSACGRSASRRDLTTRTLSGGPCRKGGCFSSPSLPPLSLLAVSLALFQLLWQLCGMLFRHRNQRPELVLRTNLKSFRWPGLRCAALSRSAATFRISVLIQRVIGYISIIICPDSFQY